MSILHVSQRKRAIDNLFTKVGATLETWELDPEFVTVATAAVFQYA